MAIIKRMPLEVGFFSLFYFLFNSIEKLQFTYQLICAFKSGFTRVIQGRFQVSNHGRIIQMAWMDELD